MIKALSTFAVVLGPGLFLALLYVLVHATPTGRRKLGQAVAALIAAAFILGLLAGCQTPDRQPQRERLIDAHLAPRTTSDWIKR